jgi:hypothetical protein
MFGWKKRLAAQNAAQMSLRPHPGAAAPSRQRRLPAPMFLLAMGLGLVFFAVLLEHPDVAHLSDAYPAPTMLLARATWVGLCKEIGFALLIAWGVSAGIERRARERDEENAEQTRGRIARDVVHAVYGLNHDANYVRTVIETNLHSKIVREFYDCEYTIEPLSPAEEKALGAPPGRLLRFTQVSKYSFLNVSGADVAFDVKYSLPARFGQKLRDFAGVQAISFDGKWQERPEVDKHQTSQPDDSYKSYCWPRVVPGHQKLEVVVRAVSIKELSDNEIWGSYHATYKGMDLVVHVKAPGVRYGLRALTATEVKKVYDTKEGDARWEIVGPILPNDSVTFWWRMPEDDGRPPVEATEVEKQSAPPATVDGGGHPQEHSPETVR